MLGTTKAGAVLTILVVGATVSCGDSEDGTTPEQKAYDPAALIAAACSDTPEGVYEMPSGLAPFDTSRRGEVVRCAKVGAVSAAELHQAAATLGYEGAAFESGAIVYRIAYRTERVAASPDAKDGISSALVMIPDKPRAQGPHPLVVAAHGSVGVADKCAPSRGELATPGSVHDDFRSVVLPLAGHGWVVIAPDYAGFGYGSTTGWMLAEDEAHSLLDATRAMGRLLAPGTLSGKVAMVGHSQGGHAVLAAQSMARSYGLEGTLVGVAAFAPIWFTNKSWGAALAMLKTSSKSEFAYATEYFYTHAELYDGAGKGLDMILPDKREQMRTVLTTGCLWEVSDKMPDFGTVAADVYDKTFVEKVGLCGVANACADAPADVWIERFRADRPAVDPEGAPILAWFGGQDGTVSPGFAKCGIDKLRLDLGASADAKLTVCADATAVHGGFLNRQTDLQNGITRRAADAVDAWISARLLGTAEPAACPGEQALAPDGGTLECRTPPSNTD